MKLAKLKQWICDNIECNPRFAVNCWKHIHDMDVYLRVGHVGIDGEILSGVVTIATVNVKDGKRGRGVFTNFIENIEALNYPVYVENVHEYDRLGMFLKRRGYKEVNHYGLHVERQYSTNWFKRGT